MRLETTRQKGEWWEVSLERERETCEKDLESRSRNLDFALSKMGRRWKILSTGVT